MAVKVCLNTTLEYMGAKVRVEVLANTQALCSEVLSLSKQLTSTNLDLIDAIVRRHGGCKVLSTTPLIVETRDRALQVKAQPLNIIARMAWDVVVCEALNKCG